MKRSLFVCFASLALVACSNSDEDSPAATPAEDAAVEAEEGDASGPDGDNEAGPDGDNEAGPDGDNEAGPDAQHDAGPDAHDEAETSDAAACKLVKPYATKNPTCNDCAEAYCCAEVNDCYENLACDDSYVNCMLACVLTEDAGKPEIDACIAECGQQYPEGKTIYETLDTCIVGACATQCQ